MIRERTLGPPDFYQQGEWAENEEMDSWAEYEANLDEAHEIVHWQRETDAKPDDERRIYRAWTDPAYREIVFEVEIEKEGD